jgi:outer membrane protein TolC
MSVSKQIFNRKTVEANLLKTGIQGRSLANTIRITEKDLKKAITTSYIDAWSAFSDISVSMELISFAKEQGNILKSLTESGIYKQTDYLAFMIDLQGQELQLREQKMNFRKQVSDLYLLCGIKDTAAFSPVRPELDDVSFSKEKNNPFLMRFFIDSLRISNEHLLIDRNYKPAVGWFSDAGLINNDPKVIYQNFGLSIGLNLTMPVYDGNQRKLNHKKLKTEEAVRSGYAVAYKREYDQQVQQLTFELKQTRELLPAVRSQVSNAEMLVNQEKELVGRGSGSVTDYLIAVKNYLSVRKSINQYEARILQIQNEINYLTN